MEENDQLTEYREKGLVVVVVAKSCHASALSQTQGTQDAAHRRFVVAVVSAGHVGVVVSTLTDIDDCGGERCCKVGVGGGGDFIAVVVDSSNG